MIVPYLRGYGTTRFLSSATFRNGQQSALALDTIALMDALKIESAIVGGCDWGARTACIMAALWPERCRALVSVSGYLIGSQELNQMPLPPKAELEWWYQFYFATERGRAGYEKNTARVLQADLAARIAEVELRRRHVRALRSVLRQPGSRRHRHPQLPLAARPGESEPRYEALEKRLAQFPAIAVPTITLEATPMARRIRTPAPTRSSSPAVRAPRHQRRGIGHNLPQEAPQAFAQAIVDVDRSRSM